MLSSRTHHTQPGLPYRQFINELFRLSGAPMPLDWRYAKFRRLYVREEGKFAQMSFWARNLAAYLLKLVDDRGELALAGRGPVGAIAFQAGATPGDRRILRRVIVELFDEGYLVHDESRDCLVIRNFTPAQRRQDEREPVVSRARAGREPVASRARAGREPCTKTAPSIENVDPEPAVHMRASSGSSGSSVSGRAAAAPARVRGNSPGPDETPAAPEQAENPASLPAADPGRPGAGLDSGKNPGESVARAAQDSSRDPDDGDPESRDTGHRDDRRGTGPDARAARRARRPAHGTGHGGYDAALGADAPAGAAAGSVPARGHAGADRRNASANGTGGHAWTPERVANHTEHLCTPEDRHAVVEVLWAEQNRLRRSVDPSLPDLPLGGPGGIRDRVADCLSPEDFTPAQCWHALQMLGHEAELKKQHGLPLPLEWLNGTWNWRRSSILQAVANTPETVAQRVSRQAAKHTRETGQGADSIGSKFDNILAERKRRRT